ncbi:MAG: RND transporter [Salinivirgaceae bacterium]|nr:MAG: RND transporter [Salinivirgaceae bacterium]
MKKKGLIWGGALLALLVIIWISFGSSDQKTAEKIYYSVKQAPFNIVVTTTGELQAENSMEISAPSGLRSSRIYNVKITDLVPEGTIVDSGEKVASLDQSEISKKLNDLNTEYQTKQNQFLQTKLDTTLEMRQARDELINLNYALEESKIKLEQSKFEPPATIRQAEINMDKAKRNYEQAVENYKVKSSKASAKMQEVESDLAKTEREQKEMMDLISEFTIKAPKSGMVIYKKNWNGSKRKVGSNISPWDPIVATLPDMSSMISRAYINEVDISKIKKGLEVRIGIDAFPNKKFKGEITEVANVGEQRPGSDAKVFEVTILLKESDPVLKPGMTTSNEILVAQYENVLSVPIEAILATDTASYVFVKQGVGLDKREVQTGPSNDNFMIIETGIEEGEEVTLNLPE